MNDVFKLFFSQLVIVFFDDILVYRKNFVAHISHLETIIDILQSHRLYAKQSKCLFACSKIEYLGHIISFEGLKTDPNKIDSMLYWPTPKNLKAPKGFLSFQRFSHLDRLL